MRAVRLHQFGGPEVMAIEDVPEPVAAEGEVLIDVDTAGVNFGDLLVREGSYMGRDALPVIPGWEVAGRRADTGERVVALCGTGGYAEQAIAPEALTFPIPDGVEDGAAVAMLVQGLTAYHLYRTSAQIRPGESVVVHAAAGGVGSLAVQLGKPLGAGRVIATASTERKRALALELGADAAIDPSPDGLKDRIQEANGGAKVDVVFEMAGGQVFEQSLAALAPFGRIVAYGIASREPNSVVTGDLMRTSRAVAGFWLMHCLGQPALVEEALTDLFGRIARGELRVVIGETYPLADARRAQEDLAARRTTGKLLLDPHA